LKGVYNGLFSYDTCLLTGLYYVSDDFAYKADEIAEKINFDTESKFAEEIEELSNSLKRIKKDSEILLNKDNEEIMKRLKHK